MGSQGQVPPNDFRLKSANDLTKDLPSIERGLPSNIDAERFVLGSVMLSAELWDQCQGLKPEDFSLEGHRRIFKRMQDIIGRGECVDRITVANDLMAYGELESCGGLTYLVSLDEGLPQLVNIASYVAIVKNKSQLRRLVFMGRALMNTAMIQEHTPLKLVHDLGKSLTRFELTLDQRKTLLTPSDVMKEHGGSEGFMLHAIKPGISTGYPSIDEMIMGLQEGCHYVVGGRTGSGKSTLAQNIALNVAESGFPVAFFSLEMSREILLARAVCARARVPFQSYIKNELSLEDRQRAMRHLGELAQLPFHIDDEAGMTISEFAVRVDRAVAQHKIRLVILDYLQIVNADPEMRTRMEYDRVTLASTTCRMVARKHGISTIAISQVARPNDKRKLGEPPTVGDLKASGGVENDAAAVLLVHRREMYLPTQQELKGQAEVIIAKSRVGGQDTLNFLFDGPYYRFREAPKIVDGYVVRPKEQEDYD